MLYLPFKKITLQKTLLQSKMNGAIKGENDSGTNPNIVARASIVMEKLGTFF